MWSNAAHWADNMAPVGGAGSVIPFASQFGCP
jgi:hypothetical protein